MNTSLIGLTIFVVFIIFGMVMHVRKSGLAIGLFALTGICLMVVTIMFGVHFFQESPSEEEITNNPEQTEVDEKELDSIQVLKKKMSVGLSIEDYAKVIEEIEAENPENFYIPNDQKGYIWKASDGYLIVITNHERIVSNTVVDSFKDAEKFKEKVISEADEGLKNPDKGNEPDSESNTDTGSGSDSGSNTNSGNEPDAGGEDSSDGEVEEPTNNDDSQDYILYKVAKGDTLWSIAQRAEVTVEKIQSWNNLDTNTIYVGQTLKIYGKYPGPPPPLEPSKPLEPENPVKPSIILSHGNLQKQLIAFTFDAGSDAAGIQILDVLKKHGLKSTFFLTGKWVEKYPQYAKRIVADGHEISSHSYAHPDFTKISYNEMLEDLSKAENVIKSITGINPRPYFRFPYGAYNSLSLKAVGESGYPYSIHWSLDTIDWRQPATEVIMSRIIEGASNGDIVLMHIGGIHTPEAVDKVIPILKEKGYDIVPVSEVLE